MALSNAERQRRFRERRNQSLRNSGQTLAAAYMVWIQEVEKIQPEDFPPEGRSANVAESVLHVMYVLGDGVNWANPTDAQVPMVNAIGGRDYCKALDEWREACSEVDEYNKGRKAKNRKAMPTPPDIPVT